MASFDSEVFDLQYKDEDNVQKVRTVGLELEVVVTNINSPMHRSNVIDRESNYDDDDYDEDNDYYDDGYTTDKLQDAFDESNTQFAAVGVDGSDIELVTHPDSMTFYKEGGSKRFKECMKYLKQNCAGGEEAPNSGTHVNIGKLENDDENYIMDNAYWICMNFAIQLQKIAGRVTHWARFENYQNGTKTAYIPAIQIPNTNKTASVINMQKADTIGTSDKRTNKSKILVNKSHTYEFRLFKATTDINETLAWIELCHNIIEIAAGKIPTKEVKFIDLIKGEYIYKYIKKLKGARRITDIEMKASVQNTLQFQCYDSNGTIIL